MNSLLVGKTYGFEPVILVAERKENKWKTCIRTEDVKLFLFTDDLILHEENLKQSMFLQK